MSLLGIFFGKSKPSKPEHREEYSFCETVTAGATTFWHIRKLSDIGKKFSGGTDTPALCGRKVSWDLTLIVRRFEVASGRLAPKVCRQCRKAYLNLHE